MVIELLTDMNVFKDMKVDESEDELIKGWFENTISNKNGDGDGDGYPNISLLWETLLQRVESNTAWHINNKTREIVPTHYNEIIF